MATINDMSITAILLVAGVGRRLGAAGHPPKVLLEFGGQTLLERHLRALLANGVEQITLTVGHGEEAIRQEVARLGLGKYINFVANPYYRQGSLLSLWAQSQTLRGGSPILVMDGDVLYGEAMISRLLSATADNALLIDRDLEPGDEPVKVCFRDGRIVDLRKKPTQAHDWHGESVGFFRFSAAMASALADACADHVERGETATEYEEAIRDVILRDPERFTAIDISDLPWTEIDFDRDITHARDVVLPQLESHA